MPSIRTAKPSAGLETASLLVGVGGDPSPRSIPFEKWTRGASFGLSKLEGQLGTLERPFDPKSGFLEKSPSKTLKRRS